MSYPNPAMNVLSDYMRYEEANEIAQSPLNFQSIDASAFDQEIDIANNTKKMYQEMESGGHTLVKEEPFRLPGMKAVDRFVGNVAIDVVNNVMNTVMDVEDYLRDKGLDIPFFKVEEGGIRYAPASERRADLAKAKEQGLPQPNFNFQNMEGAGAIEQAVQPMASFLGTMLLTPGGLIPKTASAAFTMNPELGNLSTFLKELGINNEVINFLDSKVDAQADAEQRLIARVKNLAEEGIISAALEATLVPSLVVAKQLMQQFGGERLPDLAAKAQARIDERSASTTLYSGVDPTPLIDEAIVAANKMIGNKQVDSVPQPKIDPQDNIARIEAPTDNEPGIIAFHGSGADFDEFKLDKIGTGEGAQKFGYGLYFSENEDIAKFYKNNVLARKKRAVLTYDNQPIKSLRDTDAAESMDRKTQLLDDIANDVGWFDQPIANVIASRIKRAEDGIKQYKKDPDELSELIINSYQNDLKILNQLDASKFGNTGKTYKVELLPKQEELLDYDLPFSKQTDFVKNALRKASVVTDDFMGSSIKEMLESGADIPGKEIIETLRKLDGTGQASSQFLNKFGIKGITLSETGRKGIQPITYRNYVIFDDAAVNILAKYGIVGPVAVTALSKPEPTKNEQ